MSARTTTRPKPKKKPGPEPKPARASKPKTDAKPTAKRKPSRTGRLAKKWREYKGLSQTDAARRAGVTRTAWVGWETGWSSPLEKRMIHIAKAFDVSLAEFQLGPPDSRASKKEEPSSAG